MLLFLHRSHFLVPPVYGFKSVKTLPKNDQLNQFENDLYDMVQNSEFHKVISNFQARLSDDIRNIKKNPKLLILADKTNNLYELTADEQNKLLTENIWKTYKKSNLSTMYTINAEAKVIAQDLKIDERIEQYNQKQTFITLKDHKENFKNNPNCR